MSSFRSREEPDGLVIMLDDPAGLNDFRSSAFRDSLYDAVQSRDAPRIAFALNSVDYLSSSGVAILVGLKRRIDAKNGKLVLFGVQPIVFDLLRIMKLNEYFTFAEDEARALASLRPVSTA
jgi:anti-sigma B factor antagonist